MQFPPSKSRERESPGGPLVEGQQQRDGQTWEVKCHGKGNGEEKTPVCSPLMRLALSQREDIIKKPISVSSAMSRKKGQSVLALVSERVISAKILATLTDTLQ
jgi:hypothetical protein